MKLLFACAMRGQLAKMAQDGYDIDPPYLRPVYNYLCISEQTLIILTFQVL